jgi:hypothetical protein
MTTHLNMPIPSRSRGEMIWLSFLTILAVVFSILAVFDLVTQEAIIAPVLWLGFVALVVWQGIEREGDFRKFSFSIMGVFAGTEFIEIAALDDQSPEIRFVIQAFEHRSVQWSVCVDRVVSVEWNSGQATAMAGRDMQDWHLCLWFKEDSTKSRLFKPGQDIYVIGPSRRKQETEVFALAFVDFLRRANLPLTREGDARFVRSEASLL